MLQIKDFRETRVYQEALEEGREKGRQEVREEVAVRMLAEKWPVAEVAEVTGMPVRRVRQLKERTGSEG